MRAVVDHGLRVRYFDAIRLGLVRVHHEHWVAFLHRPVDLRQHRTELKVLIDADAAGPDAGADGAHSLDDDQRGLCCVQLFITFDRSVELFAHKDGAGSFRLLTVHLGRARLWDTHSL